MSDLTQTAIHEAGHTVAHVRLGIDHDGASIIPDGTLMGAARAEGQQHVWDKAGAEEHVLAFCAGYAALVAAGCADDVARGGTGDDFEQVGELIEFWGLPGTVEDWQARAVELMRRPENVATVVLVAKHLLQYKKLDGDYCNCLVELADGEATEAEFASYL